MNKNRPAQEYKDRNFSNIFNGNQQPNNVLSNYSLNKEKKQGGIYTIVKIPKTQGEQIELTNCLAVSPYDFKDNTYVICDDFYIFSTRVVTEMKQGHIGASLIQRDWAQWSLGQSISVASYDPSVNEIMYMESMDLEIGFVPGFRTTEEQFDGEVMAKWFSRFFQNQILTLEQKLIFDFKSYNIKAVVKNIKCIKVSINEKKKKEDMEILSNSYTRGILTLHTSINIYKTGNSNIRIKASTKRPNANSIIQPNFKFEDMGIGGLDSEFSAIFRRAFASRIFPSGLVDKLGIQHVKGILLYGPPGTGKTLMARQIGKMLNAREPKIVNGPEILNKFVGQSEENIRKLFFDAEKEYREKGEDSGLHIIIFDELDAICKQRGSRNDGTGVSDSVVNQLLTKLDGVDVLNNILIIGMTNRLDMIDEALLRPGRLEVHMEISLPDEHGRKQILKIHTSKMKKNEVIDCDVDLDELAALTKNFSGAEIGGLIKSASSFAFNRHVKVGTVAGVSEDVENLKVNRMDFINALKEVKPAFGVNEEELEQSIRNGIIKFSSYIEDILNEGRLFVEQVRKSERTPLISLLLHGPPGSGKTALAATIALASEFPFIKLISPEFMIGFSENAKVSALGKIFNDSYKSPLSVIVVDNIERLLDWVPIGPRFSNTVLQTLMILFRKQPPKSRRLLIIVTSSEKSVLSHMGILSSFDADIPVPNVLSLHELDTVLRHLEILSDTERDLVLKSIKEVHPSEEISIGISKIISIAETARQDEEYAERLVELIIKAIASN
ncbi:hypothetical protein MERGE_000894 [Pneumocystis wakefieldiae]|uniref:Vesicular-fusion protein SEC18 n=1 Tax=Pneumocystis wakefieldiae TaxID=38082 RepID=A0A899G1S8_9ASCO|nr:hypothetical protein MERGE_000894 [Pneumocystis wakefieldiae]